MVQGSGLQQPASYVLLGFNLSILAEGIIPQSNPVYA